jgi:hypothetical protein
MDFLAYLCRLNIKPKNVMAKTVLYDVDNARQDSEAEIIDKT